MTRMHFVRHGETDWNAEGRMQGQSDSKLTALGRSQARQLRQRLEIDNFTGFYCSSSRRTRETMAELLDGHEGRVVYLDELREIFLGPWEGRLRAQIQSEFPEVFENFWKYPHMFKLEGAEDFQALQQRGLSAIRRILGDCAGGSVLIVSHGAIIRSILSHWDGRPISRLWDSPPMPNCAESILELNGDGSGRIVKFANMEEW